MNENRLIGVAVCHSIQEMEEQFNRETDLQEKIHNYLNRFNEKELKMVLDYVKTLYPVSSAYQVDKVIAQARAEGRCLT